MLSCAHGYTSNFIFYSVLTLWKVATVFTLYVSLHSLVNWLQYCLYKIDFFLKLNSLFIRYFEVFRRTAYSKWKESGRYPRIQVLWRTTGLFKGCKEPLIDGNISFPRNLRIQSIFWSRNVCDLGVAVFCGLLAFV